MITIFSATSIKITETLEAQKRTSEILPVPHIQKLYTPEKPWTNRAPYSKFMLFELWKHVNTPFVLVVQWDGFAINADQWTDEFLKYDYIGAPWTEDSRWPNRRVGNGGFSLRSKKWIEIGASLPLTDAPEDEWMCRDKLEVFEKANCRIAPLSLALKFSKELSVPEYHDERTFGFHGSWNAPKMPIK